MKDETLLKLSFLGFIVFFTISIIYFQISTTSIKSVEFGKYYCIKGTYTKIKETKNCIIGKIEDKTGALKVFSCNTYKTFETLKKIQKEQNLKICGKIEEYKGEKEIIPYKIVVIS